MRLSATLAACLALTWPMAVAGATSQADSIHVQAGAAEQAVAPDSAAAEGTTPTPTDYVAALTRQALAAHLATAETEPAPKAKTTVWKARLAATLSWAATGTRAVGRLVSRPPVRNVLLPLLLLVPTMIVVWRLGTARGRETALRTSSGRLRVVRDLAARGGHVPDIARRTRMAREGVSLAVRLAGRGPGAVR